jgi:hypothetical protein
VQHSNKEDPLKPGRKVLVALILGVLPDHPKIVATVRFFLHNAILQFGK